MTIERIVATVLMLLLVALGRLMHAKWNNPVTVIAAPWAVTLLGQLFFSPDFPFSGLALLVITLHLGVFTVGAGLAAVVSRPRRPAAFTIEVHPAHPSRWRLVMWASMGVVATYFVILIVNGYQLGFVSLRTGPSDPYSLHNYLLGSWLRWPFRLAQTLAYVAVFFAGIDMVMRRRVSVPAAVILLGMVLVTLSTSTRTPALLSMSYLVCVALVWSRDLFARINLRTLGVGVFIAVFIVALASSAFLRRYDASGRTQSHIVASVTHSLLGPPSSLSLYLGDSYEWYYGVQNGRSLQGPLALLGVIDRSITIYDGYYLTSNVTQKPNVFTAFRFLMDDVGIGGSVLLMALSGFLTGTIYNRFQSRPSLVTGSLLVSILMLLLWLPLTLLTSYVYWYSVLIVPTIVLPWALQLRGLVPAVIAADAALRRPAPFAGGLPVVRLAAPVDLGHSGSGRPGERA